MTKENIDELILFVLKKYGKIMRPAIARYIRKEFDRDIDTGVLKARLKSLTKKLIIESSENPWIKGNFYSKTMI